MYIYSDGIFLNRRIKVTVSSDSNKNIIAKKACRTNTDNQLIVPEFSLQLLGASKAELDLKVAGQIYIDTKGASKVELKGSSNSLKITSSGASKIEAKSSSSTAIYLYFSQWTLPKWHYIQYMQE